MKAQSRQAKTKARQDAFLAAYILIGSVKGAAEAVPVPRATVMKWSSNNVLGFKERYLEAQEDFRESLQDMAMDRVKNQKPGDNPVLLITMLNATGLKSTGVQATLPITRPRRSWANGRSGPRRIKRTPAKKSPRTGITQ